MVITHYVTCAFQSSCNLTPSNRTPTLSGHLRCTPAARLFVCNFVHGVAPPTSDRASVQITKARNSGGSRICSLNPRRNNNFRPAEVLFLGTCCFPPPRSRRPSPPEDSLKRLGGEKGHWLGQGHWLYAVGIRTSWMSRDGGPLTTCIWGRLSPTSLALSGDAAQRPLPRASEALLQEGAPPRQNGLRLLQALTAPPIPCSTWRNVFCRLRAMERFGRSKGCSKARKKKDSQKRPPPL